MATKSSLRLQYLHPPLSSRQTLAPVSIPKLLIFCSIDASSKPSPFFFSLRHHWLLTICATQVTLLWVDSRYVQPQFMSIRGWQSNRSFSRKKLSEIGTYNWKLQYSYNLKNQALLLGSLVIYFIFIWINLRQITLLQPCNDLFSRFTVSDFSWFTLSSIWHDILFYYRNTYVGSIIFFCYSVSYNLPVGSIFEWNQNHSHVFLFSKNWKLYSPVWLWFEKQVRL